LTHTQRITVDRDRTIGFMVRRCVSTRRFDGVFVPRKGAIGEDDGYLMAYVFNGERNASGVVILSAQDFAGTPLAVVELPVRVPFGFHGDWVSDQN
jgi:carotenoid cleavage dioxygenase-like enzyme